MTDGLVMAAHQPNLLPYLGFFDKMRLITEIGKGDAVYVIRDDCQYVERDWHNRQKIRTNSQQGFTWLNIPVDKAMEPLAQIKIRHDKKIDGKELWNSNHVRLIEQFYKKAPYFADFWPGLKEIYGEPGDNLADFNFRVIEYLAKAFDLAVPLVRATSLPLSVFGSNASETLANMCEELGAKDYVSGAGGRDYLDAGAFEGNVRVLFQEYAHPTYPQNQPGEFVPYMGSIDALFLVGRLPRSGETIRGSD